MSLPRTFLFSLMAAALVFAGCDSGGPDIQAFEGAVVEFASAGMGATPSDSLVSVPVTLQNPQGAAVSVEVLFAAEASTVADSAFERTVTITFPASAESGATQTITVDISDVDISEGPVTAYFALQQVQSEAAVKIGAADEFALSIGAMSIAKARDKPKGTTVTVKGVVTRIVEGTNIYIQDETAGIVVYAPGSDAGGEFADAIASNDVTIGDRVRVTGVIDAYGGLLEIVNVGTAYTVVSSGNDLPEPTTVTIEELLANAEQYEGTLVRIEGVTTDASGSFKAGGSEGNYTVSDGTGTITLRLPSNSYYAGRPIPEGEFTIRGVVGEYFGAYQVFAVIEGDIIYGEGGGGGSDVVTILSEGFQDGDGQRGLGVFTPYSVSSDSNWTRNTFDGSTFYAYINAYNADKAANDWLISPALNFDSYTGETLTFESDKRYDGPDLNVLISTDYDGSGNPEDFTWTDITERATLDSDAGSYGFAPSGEVDISDFNGTEVYIAFQYISEVGNAATWELDNIKVTGQPK